MEGMLPSRPVPATGSVFLDARADGHALRVTWHPEAEVVVLSVWKDNVCAATVRLHPDQAVELVETLVAGLLPRSGPGAVSA
jgi:hypothetical protein